MLFGIFCLLMAEKFTVCAVIESAPGGEALAFGVELIGEVDIGAAVQQVA